MNKKTITEEMRQEADSQIKAQQRQINYDTKDYTVELEPVTISVDIYQR